MTHTVLARKWRPNKFADIVGQSSSVAVLKNIISTNRLHHAYLLTGTRGVGKTTIARIIAKALNCSNLIDAEPCCKCTRCTDITRGNFIDVIEIDAASNTGVDNIREVIENSQYTPTEGPYKVYIIDEVHMLSKAAFNAMLKTLEEPPAHIIFILATTDPQKLPITILSRCLQLKLRNLLPQEISNHLAYVLDNEQINYETEALDTIANNADGSMRDALSILDQAIAYTNSNVTHKDVLKLLGLSNSQIIYDIIESIIQMDGNKLINIAENCYNNGDNLYNILTDIAQILCDISIKQLTGNAHKANDKIDQYTTQISVNDVQLFFEITNLGLQQMQKSTLKYSIFCMTLLRMLAFKLGTNHELILDNNNFNVKHIDKNEPPEEQNQQSKLIDNKNINNIKTLDKTIPNSENWFDIVKKSKITPEVYPLLANAKFESYENQQLTLTINQNYENIFVNHKKNCESCLAQILNISSLSIKAIFTKDVNSTYKEQIDTEVQQNQDFAKNSVHNDDKLASIMDAFSATIMPDSIIKND